MKIYSCEIHIEQILEDFIEKEERISNDGSFSGR